MRICFTGDAIMLTPPTDRYWRDNRLLEIIRGCDVRGGNLEMVLSGDRAFASTFCGGQWLATTPEKLDLLARYGFDYFNTANNHTMDYSYRGLEITGEELDKRGILHTGAGASLSEASAPAWLSANGAKVAFVSCTASCDDAARAGDPSANIPARPGVSMLRHSQRLYVTAENLAVIDAVAEATCVNARFLKAVRMGIHSLSPEIHRLGRLEFVLGEENKKVTACHRGDLQRITDSVRAARESGADIVAVSVHSHDIKGESDDTADDYLEEFARACVDAGASVVVGTGTHQLKGIEIYRGCPIFYSLGNFMFRDEFMPYAPRDYYDRYHVPDTIDPEAFLSLRTKNGTVGLDRDPYNYRSVVPVLEYDGGTLTQATLHPIELGFEGGDREKGFPYCAEAAVREEIAERLQRLSAPYGTRLVMDGAIIRLGL